MPRTSRKSLLDEARFFPGPYDLGFIQGIDVNGDPVERSKQQHPYSYSPYVIWRKRGTQGPGKHGVYSDRLYTWDPEKHDRLCMKLFGNRGQVWSSRAHGDIEAFLRDYYDKPDLELQVILEGCDESSGFPVGIFYYS